MNVVTNSNNPDTPVERAVKRNKWRWWAIVLLILLVILVYLFFFRSYTPHYKSDLDHFKYGSIGSEAANGLPHLVWQALPLMFPDAVPHGEPTIDEKQFYQRFGFLYEDGRDLPIGVSERRVQGIDRVWLNCAVCHVGTYENNAGERELVVGAPSNNLRLLDFIQFLRTIAVDNTRLNAEYMFDRLKANDKPVGFFTRQFYRYLVMPRVRQSLLQIREQLAFLDRDDLHDWGPGRVDTFNPYKSIQFNFPMDKNSLPSAALNGSSDYPAIWMQEPRKDMQLHWDGNNSSLDERNLSAALGAGVTPVTVDLASIKRVRDWLLEFPAPKFPISLLQDAVVPCASDNGMALYKRYCADCHGYKENGRYIYQAPPRQRPTDAQYSGSGEWNAVGKVVPLSVINTDPGRFLSYTQEFAGAQNLLYAGYPWRFSHFKKTQGYANHPLDGIWARSPYLHNGAVPTLRDLLDAPAQRPQVFCRGSDRLDVVKVGYVVTSPDSQGQCPPGTMLFDTRLQGNSNAGHSWPEIEALSDEDKMAIVNYMKTF